MINKIIIDGENVELNESTPMPYTHMFQQAKTHEVKFGLDSTDEICAYAFKDCEDLTKIQIPPVIKMLKRGAFQNCKNLPEITLSKNIEYIGKSCFDGCDNLKEIKFERETPPEVYCTIPAQTTCFIPDDTKYVKVEFEDIDTSGDIDYFTRTDWNQYEHVDDLTEITPTTYYYRNQWDNVCENYRIKENKDRYPVTGIAFEGTTISKKVGDSFKLTYTILPENCTNYNLTWMKTSNDFTYEAGNEPNVVDVKMLSANTQGTATLTCYAESGIRATVTFSINAIQ